MPLFQSQISYPNSVLTNPQSPEIETLAWRRFHSRLMDCQTTSVQILPTPREVNPRMSSDDVEGPGLFSLHKTNSKMSSLDVERDLRWCSKRYRSETDTKRPDERRFAKMWSSGIFRCRTLRFPPRYGGVGWCGGEMPTRCADVALASFNQQGQSIQRPAYRLVEALGCVVFTVARLYHCNFLARPLHSGPAETMLFFAELKGEIMKLKGIRGKRLSRVMYLPAYSRCCCILGPPGTKTGFHGCTCCLGIVIPRYIQHPRHGFVRRVRPKKKSQG